jgi:hypothetical protein
MEKMHDFEEKKWFVYLNDHHEGPFSLSDLHDRMNKGEVSTSSYVWAEGMDDWKVMTDVEGCRPLLPGHTTVPNSVQEVPMIETISHEPVSSSEDHAIGLSQGLSLETKVELDPSSLIEKARLESAAAVTTTAPHANPAMNAVDKNAVDLHLHTWNPAGTPAAPKTLQPTAPGLAPVEEETEKRGSIRKGRIIFFTILLLSAALASAYFQGMLNPILANPAISAAMKTANEMVQPGLLKLTAKFPTLSRWISPIPKLDDVSQAEFEELRNAASANLEKNGPSVAIAASTSDLANPYFYVASNLPDKTLINIYVQGVPDTLLNQLSFSTMVQAVIEKRLAKSPVVKLSDLPLPRGQYEVFATEADKQPPETLAALGPLQPLAGAKLPAGSNPNVKLLATKSVFLGGLKDSTYAARLKEYHDKLQEKATTELTEIKQMAMSLESALNETNTKFKGLRRVGKKKQWEDFSKSWQVFENQLKTAFDKWTPEVLEKEFFYGGLYKMLKDTQQSIENVHNVQSSYFTGSIEANTFDIKVGQAAALADNSMVSLKAKIEAAEKLQPTPNGMPRRDGL